MMQIDTHSGAGSLAPASECSSSYMYSYYLRQRQTVGRTVFVKRGPLQGRMVLVVTELSGDRLGVYLDGRDSQKRVLHKSDIIHLFSR